MNKILIIILIAISLNISCNKYKDPNIKQNIPTKITSNNFKNDEFIINAKRDILCLMIAYPSYIKDVEYKDGYIYILMRSGEKILYDDKKNKNFEEKILNADIQDMMEQIYPIGNSFKLMDENFDPGRARCYPFFKSIYGRNKSEIEKNLTIVKTPFGSFQFNKNNNADVSFEKVMRDIYILKQDNNINKFILPISGTYNYRNIAGTNNLSAHSFGIAVDLSANKDDYWRWTNREKGSKRIEIYPKKVVLEFEKNNFIWGGKWGHFDIMHYEYRPEIILKAKYFSNYSNGEAWYGSISYDKYKEYIDKIDKAFR